MTQTGDRALVLARLRRATAASPPANRIHPAPSPEPAAPAPRFHLLDDGDALTDVFARTAVDAGCTVHRPAHDGHVASTVREIVERHGARLVAVTAEAPVAALAEVLGSLDVEVVDASDRQAVAAADIGITSVRAAVAATGSVVVASDVPGARWASLLPRVHVCVVPQEALVGAPGDVLRPLDTSPLPAALAFVTGPSRTGDIEQLLTRGVHGPVAVEVVLFG